MAISRTVQTQLTKGDFEAIEGDWLAKIAENTQDLDYFVGVARALVGSGEDSRARTLLEMLDDELKGKELWRVRLSLLQRAGGLYVAADKMHPTILATLKRLHGHRPNFQGLAEAAGLSRAPQDIPKTWEKVDRLESLLAFDVGSVVMMEGKGVGRVVEANLGLESFKVDFERIKGMTVGFKAAAKLLKPLETGHILRRKLEEPQALAALVKKDPPELLRAVLQSFARPLNATEIREALAGIVTESQWTGFWSAARKHQQVVAAGTGKQTYRWADTSEDALAEVWRAFGNADPRRKIELFRRDGGRDGELARRMADALGHLAEEAASREPGLSWEIWFALERSVGAPEGVVWAPEALLEDAEPRHLASGIEDRLLRERAYAMWREKDPRWPEIFRDLFNQEQDPRALDQLADGIAVASPKELDRIVDGLLAQPHRQPSAFAWLAERASVDEALRARNPLRLMQQIFTALMRDEFQPVRLRLLALVESGSTVPRLLSHLTEEQAPQAFEAVDRAAAIEPYQREQLVNALELRFTSLRNRKETEAPLYALRDSIEAKRQELQHILQIEIPANRKAIEEARAMGDLRENFEYKSARQRHEYLNARASSLNSDLSRVRPIEPPGDLSEIRIGTRIRLAGGNTLTILGPWESKPEEDVVSYESDLAKGILGRRIGSELDLRGETLKVEAIESAL
ncbi:MAG TPA: GreA/GreB family elongation factor [Thermoanaerobaculia bacterium]|nr:GreA/GreB family elongation factor [Thermoanaerobaculia bacterium]